MPMMDGRYARPRAVSFRSCRAPMRAPGCVEKSVHPPLNPVARDRTDMATCDGGRASLDGSVGGVYFHGSNRLIKMIHGYM